MGRSYGDSALNDHVTTMRGMNKVLAFDHDKGVVTVEGGVSLAELIEIFLPRGWFLPVTPGTKFITVGGAIASDVHGKNHHVAGCFSDWVKSFDLMLPDGSLLTVTKRNKHKDLWLATCGGMGLTGVIVRAVVQLAPAKSANIRQVTYKAANLQGIFELFESTQEEPYSVAWIDCLAGGAALGRSLLMVGDHTDDGRLVPKTKGKLAIPFDFPSFALNPLSVRAFNEFFYAKVRRKVSEAIVDVDTFFYPLDAIHDWNRIYGKNGFTQYQFVLPKAASYAGLAAILKRLAEAGLGSFLAVLKLFGKGNANWLSFPMEGYTLALDMKIQPELFPLLDELDRVVIDHGGRLYLTKDVRMTRETLEAGYPDLERFRTLRRRMDLDLAFASLQSKRLGI